MAKPSAFTGVGFWLPCGKTNFCNPLIDSISAHASDAPMAGNSSHGDPHLDDTVLGRLESVLVTRGYEHVTRLVRPTNHSSIEPMLPQGVLYAIRQQPPPSVNLDPSTKLFDNYTAVPNWPIEVPVNGLILLLTASGFGYVLAAHSGHSPQKAVPTALKEHISSLFGHTFYSHFSGLKQEQPNDPHRLSDDSLKSYQDHNLGILNFFQLNHVVEGLFNSNFDPNIFFNERIIPADSDNRFIEANQHALDDYTLGHFSQLISTPFDLGRSQPQLSSAFDNILNGTLKYPDALKLSRLIDRPDSRATVLRGFLDNTSYHCLRPLKIMIERCRRALLARMIGVTHRRTPIAQVESPNETTNQITVENEEQLRGYVMLVSAKLPIIANICRHVEQQARAISHGSATDGTTKVLADAARGKLVESTSGWDRLFHSIEDNVREIEVAIMQGRISDILHEQLQLRAEHETDAELARVRNRFGLTGGGTKTGNGGNISDWSSLLGNWGGIACTLLIWLCVELRRQGDRFPWILLVSLVVLVLILGFPFALNGIRRFVGSLKRLEEPTESEFHYEFDYDLDAPLDVVKFDGLQAGTLINIDWTTVSPSQRRISRTNPRIVESKMHGFREDTRSADESLIKIHIEVTLPWRREEEVSLWRRICERLPGIKRKDILVISLIYEILRHRASGNFLYVLKGVRAIALKDYPLDKEKVDRIRTLMVRECINILLSEAYQIPETSK